MPKLSLAKLERHLYSAADRLRQEGLDAATYKDYIFGMLFLKRSSDVFDAEHERIVGVKVEQGMAKEKAETEYGENPDFYDEFFVPERARWSYLQEKLADAKEPYGSVLDKALAALAEHNESLEHVLDHISFMRVQSNKRIVSDDACKDLVRHFSKYRLRNEDFQFSDLLGSAYEFLINMFAESAGKKGGDFYTPRDVIRLMVRILKPAPGLSVYDPCCGSGGMLIISREFIEQSGGDPTNLRLCGQVNDASAWSICKLNMLLHGVPGADIQLEDTLLHPMHREAGELERFDRVIANPPFSQNYTKSNMEYPERFRWGWAPTTGKKGDLMFTQHMLAVCKPGGMVTTVMPHGVLFRGGAEKDGERIVKSADGDAIRMDDPKGAQEYRFGGVEAPSLAFFLQIKDLFSWISGNLDSLGGLSPMSETFRQDRLLNENASQRVADMQDRTVAAVRKIVQDLCWYLYYDPFLELPLVKRVAGTNIELPIVLSADDIEGDYLEYNFDIEPYSMQHQTPESKLSTMLQLLTEVIAPFLPMLEAQGMTINWDAMIKFMSDATNIPELEDIFMDADEMMMRMQMGNQQQGPVGQPPVTKRTYERVNRTGATRVGKDMALTQAILGKGVQGEELKLGTPVG